MTALTKLIVHKNRILGKFLVMVLKNRSIVIRSNEIRIRRELPVHVYLFSGKIPNYVHCCVNGL